jgi:lysozyme family protein
MNTTPAFRIAIDRTVRFEGGYSDDPVDRGGKTKYGITEATWFAYHRPHVPPKPVGAITRAEAESVYWRLYWCDAGLDDLDAAAIPQPILSAVFDAGVHHGIGTAAKMLQRAYNVVRYDDALVLTEDGKLGPVTRGALTRFLFRQSNEAALLGALTYERGKLMASIISRDPSQRRFVRGWFGRLIP